MADEQHDKDEPEASDADREEEALTRYDRPEAHRPSNTDDLRTVPEGSPEGGAGRDLEEEHLPYGPPRDVPGVGPEGTPPGHGGMVPGIGRRQSEWRNELGMQAATEGVDEPDDFEAEPGDKARKPKKDKAKKEETRQERVGKGPKDKDRKGKKRMEGDYDRDGSDEVVEEDSPRAEGKKGKGKDKGKGKGKGKGKKERKGKGGKKS